MKSASVYSYTLTRLQQKFFDRQTVFFFARVYSGFFAKVLLSESAGLRARERESQYSISRESRRVSHVTVDSRSCVSVRGYHVTLRVDEFTPMSLHSVSVSSRTRCYGKIPPPCNCDLPLIDRLMRP